MNGHKLKKAVQFRVQGGSLTKLALHESNQSSKFGFSQLQLATTEGGGGRYHPGMGFLSPFLLAMASHSLEKVGGECLGRSFI